MAIIKDSVFSDYPGGSSVITRVLVKQKEFQNEKGDMTIEAEVVGFEGEKRAMTKHPGCVWKLGKGNIQILS